MQPLAAEDFEDALQPDVLPSTEDMRDAFMQQLYASRHELKGIALVQGLKALAALATQEKAEPETKAADARLSILDRLDALPPDHARGLVQAEIERTERLVADLYEALGRLGA